jgi:glycosyltransferase involved in cell wall biosynthesis
VPLESLFSCDAAPAYGTSPAYGTRPAYGTPPAPGPSGDEPPAYPSPAPVETMPETRRPPGTRSTPGRPGQPGAQDTPEPPAQLEPRYRGAPADGREPHVSIVLPCFNEQDHVLREIERISRVMDASGQPYELIAVDDASTDATLERLRAAEPNLPRMRIVHFPRNGGAGTVRRIGTQQAKGEIVVWTDADMTYPNDRIPEFVAMLDADLSIDQVVGARTSEAGTHKAIRVPAKWFIRKLAEKLTNSEIPDLNSGLRAFRRDVALPYLRLLPPGFSCVTTITLAFLSNEHGVVYVPIDYAKRAGVSKFRFVSDAYRYILQVLRMVMYFNPLKVLMPPALFLLGLGILKGIFDMVVHPLYFAINTVLIFVTGLIIASLALLADLIVRSRGDA